MLSQVERKMLYTFTRDRYNGEGEIIDGGSFMGSSTASLAAGLEANPDFEPRKVIHSYDMGYTPDPHNRKTKRVYNGQPYTFGESFVPILEQTIAPWRDLIDLTIGDLNEHKWTGKPIEICFIDVCKTPELNAHISRQFYPHIPVGGHLINQDFFFDRLPWIKVTMGYLSEYFEWKGRVAGSSIWQCIKPVPQEIADYDPWLAGDKRNREWHLTANQPGLSPDAAFLLDLSLVYMDGKGLDAVEKKYAEFIAHSVKLWDKKPAPRRDAQFRIDRARRAIS